MQILLFAPSTASKQRRNDVRKWNERMTNCNKKDNRDGVDTGQQWYVRPGMYSRKRSPSHMHGYRQIKTKTRPPGGIEWDPKPNIKSQIRRHIMQFRGECVCVRVRNAQHNRGIMRLCKMPLSRVHHHMLNQCIRFCLDATAATFAYL